MKSPRERLAASAADRYTTLLELGDGGIATAHLAEDRTRTSGGRAKRMILVERCTSELAGLVAL